MCVSRTGSSRTIVLLSGSSTNAHQLIYCAGLWVCEVCVCAGFPLENLSQKQDKEKLFQQSRLSWQHELHLSSSDLTCSSSSAPSQLLRLTSSLTFSDDKETLFFCTIWAATEKKLSQVQMLQLWPSTCAACWSSTLMDRPLYWWWALLCIHHTVLSWVFLLFTLWWSTNRANFFSGGSDVVASTGFPPTTLCSCSKFSKIWVNTWAPWIWLQQQFSHIQCWHFACVSPGLFWM